MNSKFDSIRDVEAKLYQEEITDGCCTPEGSKYGEHEYLVCACGLRAGFKAGFDCRDKMDNEALKVAIDALERVGKYADGEFGWSELCAETLAKIHKLIGDKSKT